jgi:hypothetical protein
MTIKSLGDPSAAEFRSMKVVVSRRGGYWKLDAGCWILTIEPWQDAGRSAPWRDKISAIRQQITSG